MTSEIDHRAEEKQKSNQRSWFALQRELRLNPINPPVPEPKPFQAKPWSKNVVCCNDGTDCRESGVWWRSQELIDYNDCMSTQDLLRRRMREATRPTIVAMGIPGPDRPHTYKYSSAGPTKSNLTKKERIQNQIFDTIPRPKKPEKFLNQLRKCHQAEGFTTETFEGFIKTFQQGPKKKNMKNIIKAKHETLELPRSAVTDFGQLVKEELYTEWDVKPDRKSAVAELKERRRTRTMHPMPLGGWVKPKPARGNLNHKIPARSPPLPEDEEIFKELPAEDAFCSDIECEQISYSCSDDTLDDVSHL